MIIESRIRTVGSFPPYPEALIRREQSQARVPIEVALRTCGPVHRAFIDALPKAWRRDRRVEIFSRLLYLKPGWYPLSPHYHFDWRQGADGARVETIIGSSLPIFLTFGLTPTWWSTAKRSLSLWQSERQSPLFTTSRQIFQTT